MTKVPRGKLLRDIPDILPENFAKIISICSIITTSNYFAQTNMFYDLILIKYQHAPQILIAAGSKPQKYDWKSGTKIRNLGFLLTISTNTTMGDFPFWPILWPPKPLFFLSLQTYWKSSFAQM